MRKTLVAVIALTALAGAACSSGGDDGGSTVATGGRAPHPRPDARPRMLVEACLVVPATIRSCSVCDRSRILDVPLAGLRYAWPRLALHLACTLALRLL
jgi:hypothetical protein